MCSSPEDEAIGELECEIREQKELIEALFETIIHDCPLISLGSKNIRTRKMGCKKCPEEEDLNKNRECWMKVLVGDCRRINDESKRT